MQNDCTENTLIKLREGTTQQERYKALLNPENIELMGFDVKDWMLFAEEFSKHVQLYSNENHTTPSGTWEPFHNASAEIKQVIETYAEGDITPQLALFIAFLKLLNQSKDRFNQITKRHLDFYYKEVLQFDKKDETADHAYVIFELAKNASEQFLSDETLLKAGKDSEGNTIHYQLDEEIVINKAKVAALRNTYATPTETNWYASSIANSADGEGAADENGATSWLPFGNTSRKLAKKGFSVSSPSLVLSEGVRIITITASFNSLSGQTNLMSFLTVEHTGEKGWVTLPATAIKRAATRNKKLIVEITLSEDDEKITPYDAEIHEGAYESSDPIVRILFSPENTSTSTYKTYLNIAKASLKSVDIETTGVYSEGLSVKNDLGKIKTDNPFYPFGPQAKKNAKLKISADEWIGKRIQDVQVSLDWKDYPDNFETHYQHYIQQYLNIKPPNTFLSLYTNNAISKTQIIQGRNGGNRFRATASYIGNFKSVSDSVATAAAIAAKAAQAAQAAKEDVLPNAFPEETLKEGNGNWLSDAINKAKQHTEEEIEALNYVMQDAANTAEELAEQASEAVSSSLDIVSGAIPADQQLFFGKPNTLFKHFLPPNTTYIPKASDDYFIQLSLQHNFLHDAFARFYTYYAINKLALPNNPYAPLAENLKVTITTKETISASKSELSVYQELPFGIKKVSRADLALVATPEKGGQLYIGIERAIADQNIQLLCQIEEGSENPDAIDAHGNAEVTWQYLYNNTWLNLKPTYLLKDQTDNFLKAGLVAFTVPKQFGDSTLFAEDYLWIRAIISKPFDTVSKFTNIHAQAAEVIFQNDDNTLEHLDNGMPADTITKLEDRLATVKKVMQPYASFGGAPKESDVNFYRRVSERLRHKNRAITLWDYEHLVLQKFNYLHKIKCLNHSTSTSFKAPGEVVLVAIPNIIDQNVYDIYKPKLSQTKLNDIKNYVNELNTLHVEANVLSPVYEPVKITVKARFYKGLDANFYEKQLKNDLGQYLAPWAFDKNQPISFGNALYASEVIFYIENLDYVDYIKDFKMLHNGEEKDEIIPTDQKSILTTVVPDTHNVTALTGTAC